MKIAKPLTLGVLHKPFRHQGRNRFSVAALGFFRLGADNERFLPESLQWPLFAAALPPDQALDEVMPKAHGEALLLGSAHAPGGTPVTDMCVRMCIGAIDKRLRIVGERAWGCDAAPAPFATMPITYARAYGGPGFAANPAGRGYRGRWRRNAGAMPNIEQPCAPPGSRWRPAAPAGFGPLGVGWLPRKDKFGTYGRRWARSDAPGFAADIDWTVFNLAPPDQWLAGHFEGGECYRLEGLHPSLPAIEGRVPALRARGFILRRGLAHDAAEEVPLRLDTVWFLPEHEIGLAVYHGQADIEDSDALDVAAVMVGYERAGQSKTLDHYRRVMALRLDPVQASRHAFDEAQLAPAWSDATAARRKAERSRAEAAALAQQQQVLDEIDAEFWQQTGMTPPAGHQPARAEPPPFGFVDAQAVMEGDFDLNRTIAAAQALAQSAQQQAAANVAELSEIVAPPPDTQAALRAALERAAVPAYDLLPPQETGQDPQVSAALAALEQAWQSGQFADADGYAQARQSVLQGPALRRKARRAAPAPTPALPLAPEAARELGRQALEWQRAGIPLAGRDLAGADLRGADFSGADLREVLLEGADLAYCRFAGADLRGAALTGARLDGADFSDALLADANLSGSSGTGACFARADMRQAQALGAAWEGAQLDGARLDGMLAVKIDLRRASLRATQARRTVLLQAQADASMWQEALLEQTVALQARLHGADFSGATLAKTVLIEAAMRDSIWTRSSWSGVQAASERTDWSGASFAGVKASGCGLHGAVLAGADFSGSLFARCDFGNADLRAARLDNALFPYSQFLQANLRGVHGRGASFFQAVCRKADLRGAMLDAPVFVQAEMSGMLTGAPPPGESGAAGCSA